VDGLLEDVTLSVGMVYVADVTALVVIPVSYAMALIVSVAPTVITHVLLLFVVQSGPAVVGAVPFIV
jgi:hypothetical protein